MGAYADQALLQVRGESGAGSASKMRSAGQSRCFWLVAMGESEDRASLQKQGVSGEDLCLQGDISEAIAVFLAGRSRGIRVSGISSIAGRPCSPLRFSVAITVFLSLL